MTSTAIRALQRELRISENRVDGLKQALTLLNGNHHNHRGGPRHLSAQARERIAKAQRQRWAKWKKANRRAA